MDAREKSENRSGPPPGPDESTEILSPRPSASPAAPPPEPTVDIGVNGAHELVSRKLLLSLRDLKCRDCSGSDGWRTRVVAGNVRVPEICGCAVLGYRRAQREWLKRRQELSTIRAQAVNVAEIEATEKRIARLAGQLAPLEAELKEREERFKAEGAELEEATKRHATAIQDHGAEITWLHEKVAVSKAAIADAEARVIELQQQLTAQKQDIARAEEARLLAGAMIEDARREMNRRHVDFERSTSRLRRDIAKVKGRLVRARVYGGVPEQGAADGESTP